MSVTVPSIFRQTFCSSFPATRSGSEGVTVVHSPVNATGPDTGWSMEHADPSSPTRMKADAHVRRDAAPTLNCPTNPIAYPLPRRLLKEHFWPAQAGIPILLGLGEKQLFAFCRKVVGRPITATSRAGPVLEVRAAQPDVDRCDCEPASFRRVGSHHRDVPASASRRPHQHRRSLLALSGRPRSPTSKLAPELDRPRRNSTGFRFGSVFAMEDSCGRPPSSRRHRHMRAFALCVAGLTRPGRYNSDVAADVALASLGPRS